MISSVFKISVIGKYSKIHGVNPMIMSSVAVFLTDIPYIHAIESVVANNRIQSVARVCKLSIYFNEFNPLRRIG